MLAYESMASPFDHCASEYAQHRPGYPRDVVDAIEAELRARASGLSHTEQVVAVDLGAGTGIFTRMLAARGFGGIAVDVGLAVLAKLTSATAPASVPHDPRGAPSVVHGRWHAVCAPAECLPVAHASADLVACAQAFHWFNPKLVFPEVRRILKPGGILALVWNNRDADVCPFWADYDRFIARYNPAYEREYRRQDWTGKAESFGDMSLVRQQSFRWRWDITLPDLQGYALSTSYIRNVLSQAEMKTFLVELEPLWSRRFGSGPGQLDMVTELFVFRRP